MIFLAVLYLLFGLFVLTLGILAWIRRLPGNSYVGLRVPEVRKNRKVWDDSHATAGPLWTMAGAALTFGGAATFVASGWLWLIPVAGLLLGLIGITAGANLGARTASLADVGASEPAHPITTQATQAAGQSVDLGALRQAAGREDKDKEA